MRKTIKEYNREYRIKNKEKINSNQKEYYIKHPEYFAKYRKEHYKKNRDKYLDKAKESYLNIKKEVFDLMGGKCTRCGFTDIRALQVDHVNGGGVKDKKKLRLYSIGYFKNVIESVSNKENKYQLLCANCNWIKKSENNEVRVSFRS